MDFSIWNKILKKSIWLYQKNEYVNKQRFHIKNFYEQTHSEAFYRQIFGLVYIYICTCHILDNLNIKLH